MKFNVIVAATENGGIGNKGKLPWCLRGDLAHFARMTKAVVKRTKMNCVIMGRRTFFSIPENRRPLEERLNVVISNTMDPSANEGFAIYGNFMRAVQVMSEFPLSESVENIWICGGSSIYKEAIESPYCHRIYLTRILAEFECDTFLPPIPPNFVQVVDPKVSQERIIENGIPYEYEVYEQMPKGRFE